MNKIIVALDPLRYAKATAMYAAELAKENSAHLVAVFLEDFTYHSYNLYELIGHERLDPIQKNTFEDKDSEIRAKSIQHFTECCTKYAITHSVHHDRNIAIRELILESIYADLLIIGSEETIIHYKENPPTTFVRSLLAEAQCPVHVVPAAPKAAESLFFLYDGSPSSVHAIRTFCHLLPSMVNLPIDVVMVNKPHSNCIAGKKLFVEMMKDHFNDIRHTNLTGNPEIEIVRHLKSHKGSALAILGAYRRSNLSRWYRHSMADVLMEELRMPLFIAHN